MSAILDQSPHTNASPENNRVLFDIVEQLEVVKARQKELQSEATYLRRLARERGISAQVLNELLRLRALPANERHDYLTELSESFNALGLDRIMDGDLFDPGANALLTAPPTDNQLKILERLATGDKIMKGTKVQWRRPPHQIHFKSFSGLLERGLLAATPGRNGLVFYTLNLAGQTALEKFSAVAGGQAKAHSENQVRVN